MAKRLFFSHAPEDEHFRAELETHVAPLIREQAVVVWSTHMLAAGEDSQVAVEAQIDAADAILLLLSSDFFASREIQHQQVQRALHRRAACGVPVVPVLVRPCVWRYGPLADLQPLPRHGKAISSWPNRDEAWVEVVEGIQAALAGASSAGRARATPVGGRRTGVFVGRERELAIMSEALLRDGASPCSAICALYGMAGVGKSYLADRFAAEHADRFPGGVVRLVLDPCDQRHAPSADALLTDIAHQVGLPERPDPKPIAARLRSPRTLLYIENADCFTTAGAAAGVASALDDCAVIVSGRYRELGRTFGFTQVDVSVLPPVESIDLVEREMGQHIAAADNPELERLAAALGHLPLALSLAADYLREGYSPRAFLEQFRKRGYLDPPLDAANRALLADPTRAIVGRTFEISLDLLRGALGEDADRLLAGFFALGHAPAVGFGPGLGAAVAGLGEIDFLRLASTACRHSLLDRRAGERERWTVHPLLAEMLRSRAPGGDALGRMTDWFVERLDAAIDSNGVGTGPRWPAVRGERAALVAWLPMVLEGDIGRVEQMGCRFAMRHGPFVAWQRFCERALTVLHEPSARSSALFTLGHVALSAGDLDRALSAVQEKAGLDRSRGAMGEAARADGKIADILKRRGDLDEALRIHRESVVPVFEALGDVRSRAITLGKIANILVQRGELDEALRIYREELVPAFDKLPDARSRAITLGKIADVVAAQGKLDEALDLYREQPLPVFEELGDVRLRAFTLGKIADILAARGQRDEALHIYREQVLPVFEELGDVRSCAIFLAKSADMLAARGQLDEALRIHLDEALPAFEKLGDHYLLLMGRWNLGIHFLRRDAPGDRDEAGRLLRLALATAEAMRIREAREIRNLLLRDGFEVP